MMFNPYCSCVWQTYSENGLHPLRKACTLHAAAPEMLEALKQTREIWSEWETYAPWIGEAIAKAEGKPK